MKRRTPSNEAARMGLAGALLLLVLTASAGAAPVSPPTSLTATALSSSQIRLNWADTNPNETGYFVERSLSSSSGFVQIASLGESVTTYTSTGLAAGTTYYYRVRASSQGGAYSTYSNVASARTLSTLSALNPPSSLTASVVSSSQLNLTWNDTNSNETGYLVERSLSSSSGFAQIASLGVNIRSYSNTGLAAGTTYYYRVRAVKSGTYSTYSNVASARTTSVSTGAPAAPSLLAAAAISTSQISLSWRDNSTNETAFKVERSLSSAGPWAYIGATAATGYGDSGLAAGTTYFYRVQAYNSSGSSGYSNTASAKTQGGTATTGVPVAPVSASATAASPSQINVAWADMSGNESGFKIERSSATAGWAQIGTVGANVTSFASTGLAASTAYSFRVRAYNSYGDSAYSNTASATTTGASLIGGGAHAWSTHFGGPTMAVDSAVPAGIVVDGAGSSIVVGYLKGSVNLGGGSLTSAGYGDVYMVKRASNGSYVWGVRFGGPEDDRPKGIAVDSSGNIFITGLFRGTVSFGGTAITAAPFTANGFLAKYAPSGTHLWSRRLGTGVNTDTGNAVAADGSGNVVVAASIFGTSDFGGGALTTAGGEDIVVAKYTTAGGHLWSKRIGGAGANTVTSIATDQTTGEVAFTGYFAGSMSFGTTSVTSAGTNDIFLARYSSAGAPVWTRRWGSTGDDRGAAVAVDSLGNVVAAGLFTNSVDFGGGLVSNLGGTGSGDIFVVKISSTGTLQWSKGFGSSLTLNEMAYGVDVDSAGNVAVTGSAVGTINFGSTTLTGDGWYNVFVAKFSSGGSHVWSKRFLGGGGNGNGRAIAFDGSGNVLSAGDYDVSENFGGTTLTSPGASDTYLVKFGP